MIAWTCRAARRRSLLLWLVRGCAGVTLLVVAAFAQVPVIVLAAIVSALIAFGGCPMCWTFGLIERVQLTIKPLLYGKGAP